MPPMDHVGHDAGPARLIGCAQPSVVPLKYSVEEDVVFRGWIPLHALDAAEARSSRVPVQPKR